MMMITRRKSKLSDFDKIRDDALQMSYIIKSRRKKLNDVDENPAISRHSAAATEHDQELSKRGPRMKNKKESIFKTPDKSEPPMFWQQQLENIRIMRSERNAQVDTMGCHTCSDENASEKDKNFQILLALMLSSQTKDEVTSAAMKKLTSKYKGTCNPVTFSNEDPANIEPLIYPVSFYKRKAEYIVRASKILVEKYDGCLPRNYEQICSLPGVGHKMATLAVNIAFGEIIGIGVDTHVHRTANRLGWTLKPTKTPLETKVALENWLPKELWEEINVLLVGFGQQICTPMRPKCNLCLNESICPFSGKPTKNDKLAKNLDFQF